MTKFCIFIKDDCLEEQCGIYDEYAKRCSLRNLGYLSNLGKLTYGDKKK